MIIDRLFKHQWGIELASFTANVVYSFLFSTKGEVCLGVGWNLGAINFKVDSTFTPKDCSKTVFYDITNFKSSWTGDNAKWLDDCIDSAAATVSVMDRAYPAVSN